MSALQPRVLGRSDLTHAVRYVCARVKAPAIEQLLEAAGCADPQPTAGKKARVRLAVLATQDRDGHSGAVVRLIELIAEAEDAERRRDEALRRAATVSDGMLVRATIRAHDGFSFELGVTRDPENLELAIAVLPDLDGIPIRMSLEQAREFYRELVDVGREVAERRERPWKPRSER